MARLAEGLKRGDDGLVRCFWAGSDPLYLRYHDREWGLPVRDDRRLFEKICLEGFQAGLSWLTILRKRDHFRNAFKDFDFHAVSQFRDRDVSRLLNDAGIVRHRHRGDGQLGDAERSLGIDVYQFGQAAEAVELRCAVGRVNRQLEFARQRPNAADVVAVFMGDQDRAELVGAKSQSLKSSFGFLNREAVVDQHQCIGRAHHGRIAATAAAEGSKEKTHQSPDRAAFSSGIF